MKRFMTAGWAIMIAAAVALVWEVPPTVPEARAASTQTPWRNLSPSQLSAVWWQWAFSIPVSSSPFFDETGANAFNGQPYSDLLFLGGTFTNSVVSGDVIGTANRTITVKPGTNLFFPILNTEWDNTGVRPHLGGTPGTRSLGVPQLAQLATTGMDKVLLPNPPPGPYPPPLPGNHPALYAWLTPTDTNGMPLGSPIPLAYARLQSPPFSYKLPATDNLVQFFGIQAAGTVAPAFSDGYFTFVSALTPGNYKLEFGGTIPGIQANGGSFVEAITILITVTPKS